MLANSPPERLANQADSVHESVTHNATPTPHTETANTIPSPTTAIRTRALRRTTTAIGFTTRRLVARDQVQRVTQRVQTIVDRRVAREECGPEQQTHQKYEGRDLDG